MRTSNARIRPGICPLPGKATPSVGETEATKSTNAIDNGRTCFDLPGALRPKTHAGTAMMGVAPLSA